MFRVYPLKKSKYNFLVLILVLNPTFSEALNKVKKHQSKAKKQSITTWNVPQFFVLQKSLHPTTSTHQGDHVPEQSRTVQCVHVQHSTVQGIFLEYSPP